MLKGYDFYHEEYAGIRKSGFPADADFLIFKATEGKRFKDNRAGLFADMAFKFFAEQEKPQLLGFYHYARPEINIGKAGAIAEADSFIETMTRLDMVGNAIFALDVEDKALKITSIDSWCKTWCKRVTNQLGVQPLIYVQYSAIDKFSKCAEDGVDLWLAKYGAKPTRVKPFPYIALWQYTSKPYDTNKFNGTATQWKRYAAVNLNR